MQTYSHMPSDHSLLTRKPTNLKLSARAASWSTSLHKASSCSTAWQRSCSLAAPRTSGKAAAIGPRSMLCTCLLETSRQTFPRVTTKTRHILKHKLHCMSSPISMMTTPSRFANHQTGAPHHTSFAEASCRGTQLQPCPGRLPPVRVADGMIKKNAGQKVVYQCAPTASSPHLPLVHVSMHTVQSQTNRPLNGVQTGCK